MLLRKTLIMAEVSKQVTWCFTPSQPLGRSGPKNIPIIITTQLIPTYQYSLGVIAPDTVVKQPKPRWTLEMCWWKFWMQ